MTTRPAGCAIFLNGVPSSGKSSVAAAIGSRTPAFRLLTGDDIIRQVPFAQRLPRAEELYDLTLDTIDEWLAANNVIIDGAWSEAQVLEAQSRFSGAGMYVVLRIAEAERKRREALRRDRRLAYWDPAWHDMLGADDLYDVVIDANSTRPARAARTILAAAKERWGELTL